MAQTIPLTTTSRYGQSATQLTLTALTEVGFEFDNDGATGMQITNGLAPVKNLTITAQNDPFGRAVDLTQAIGVGETYVIGFLLPLIWNSAGKVSAAVDAFADVSVAAVRYHPFS